MIKLDIKNVSKNVIGDENGLDLDAAFTQYQDRIAEIITDLNKRKDKPGQWLQWMNLGYSEETLWFVKEYAAIVRNRFENVLVLGIGGSALGGIAMSEALLKPYWNMLTAEERNQFPRIFFLDNIDPDQVYSLLTTLNLETTLVNVITKSGTTPETMAQYMVVAKMLEDKLGDDYRKH
ncbi:glucose-6-phosphate isomerase, partial [bacterium]|nr:glucose-6-phosphate isomerase [bacterium]